MPNGFVHKEMIESLKMNFEKYFNHQLRKRSTHMKVEWEFNQKDFMHAYVSGYGREELKVIKTMFIIYAGRDTGKNLTKKKISVNLIEDYEGTLSIEVNGKITCSIEPRGRLTKEFLQSFSNSLRKEV